MSNTTKCSVTPSVANFACLYDLPKIHKPNLVLRPIACNIGITSYPLSRLLSDFFPLLTPNNIQFANNSFVFIDKMEAFSSSDHSMLCLGVKSLFSNVLIVDNVRCLKVA